VVRSHRHGRAIHLEPRDSRRYRRYFHTFRHLGRLSHPVAVTPGQMQGPAARPRSRSDALQCQIDVSSAVNRVEPSRGRLLFFARSTA